jgi:hypothetical protein
VLLAVEPTTDALTLFSKLRSSQNFSVLSKSGSRLGTDRERLFCEANFHALEPTGEEKTMLKIFGSDKQFLCRSCGSARL